MAEVRSSATERCKSCASTGRRRRTPSPAPCTTRLPTRWRKRAATTRSASASSSDRPDFHGRQRHRRFPSGRVGGTGYRRGGAPLPARARHLRLAAPRRRRRAGCRRRRHARSCIAIMCLPRPARFSTRRSPISAWCRRPAPACWRPSHGPCARLRAAGHGPASSTRRRRSAAGWSTRSSRRPSSKRNPSRRPRAGGQAARGGARRAPAAEGRHGEILARIEKEAAVFAERLASREAQAAFAAFMQKGKP